ncbi:MAG: GNAT family N-acetyltransferase [Lautropia mirabilis]|nr:GNAT family N-acetyltransferase [Lautropia mirabilis]
MYRIRPYTAADRPAWNDFIRRSRNGVFLFQREYMDYHADRFEDASVIVESAQGTPRIVAVLPANRRHAPDGDHCVTHGGLTFGGLVMDEKLGGAQVLAVMEQLAAWLAGRNFVQLHYKATPHLYHRLPSEDDLYALHRLGAHTTQVLLSSTLDLQRQAPTSSQKNHALNLAKRAGIDVGRCRRADYWPLLNQTLQSRHGVGPVHTLAEIERLAGAFTQLEVLGAWQRPSDGAPANQGHDPHATADVAALPVKPESCSLHAGIVLYHYTGVTHTQYLASAPEGFETRAQHAILELAIEAARARGQRWFSFGTSTTEGGAVLNEGLLRHKEMFGARSTILQTLVLDLR